MGDGERQNERVGRAGLAAEGAADCDTHRGPECAQIRAVAGHLLVTQLRHRHAYFPTALRPAKAVTAVGHTRTHPLSPHLEQLDGHQHLLVAVLAAPNTPRPRPAAAAPHVPAAAPRSSPQPTLRRRLLRWVLRTVGRGRVQEAAEPALALPPLAGAGHQGRPREHAQLRGIDGWQGGGQMG